MDRRTLRDVERAGYRTAAIGGKCDPSDTMEGSDALARAETEEQKRVVRKAFRSGYNRAQSRGVKRSVV